MAEYRVDNLFLRVFSGDFAQRRERFARVHRRKIHRQPRFQRPGHLVQEACRALRRLHMARLGQQRAMTCLLYTSPSPRD